MQRTWSYLESIFIGSEDIRAQLPEDSSRFDIVDKDFKVLMVEMAKTPNVVKATNAEGLSEKLLELMQSLSKCEKALAEYLETKRLAFPRCSLLSLSFQSSLKGSILPPPPTCWIFFLTGITLQKWRSI